MGPMTSAPGAGFSGRARAAGGVGSMSWYRLAVVYAGEPDLTQRTRLLEYNEDDVRATLALREWMSPRRPGAPGAETEVPAMIDFRGPSPVPSTARPS